MIIHNNLATTVGQLNHAPHVVPTTHARKQGKAIKLDNLQTAKLRQWVYLLVRPCKGLSLKLLTLCTPTIVLLADACKHGLGGYLLSTGIAWWFCILSCHYWGYLTLNLLEYIASAVTIAVALTFPHTASYNCVISQLDSTTAQLTTGCYKGVCVPRGQTHCAPTSVMLAGYATSPG